MNTTRITLFEILFVTLFAFFIVNQTYGQETKQEDEIEISAYIQIRYNEL